MRINLCFSHVAVCASAVVALLSTPLLCSPTPPIRTADELGERLHWLSDMHTPHHTFSQQESGLPEIHLNAQGAPWHTTATSLHPVDHFQPSDPFPPTYPAWLHYFPESAVPEPANDGALHNSVQTHDAVPVDENEGSHFAQFNQIDDPLVPGNNVNSGLRHYEAGPSADLGHVGWPAPVSDQHAISFNHPFHEPSPQRNVQDNGAGSSKPHDGSLSSQLHTEGTHQDHFIGRFKVIMENDPQIEQLVSALRSRLWVQQDVAKPLPFLPAVPAKLKGMDPEFPDLLAFRIFWNKIYAKEVVLRTQGEQRHLLFTFSAQPRFVVAGHRGGFVGVWEFKWSEEGGVMPLYLRGFYEFPAEIYNELERQPEATGYQYTIIVSRKSREKLTEQPLTLRFERFALPRRYGKESPMQIPETRQQLLRTDDVVRDRWTVVHGKYAYVWKPSLEVLLKVQEWKRQAKMPPAAFRQIELTDQQQIKDLWRINTAFRLPRHVKMIDQPAYDPLMLCFHQKMSWPSQGIQNIVTIWRFGPMQGDSRVLYSVGLFHLTKLDWAKMTSSAIPGLRNSMFQYDRLTIP